MASGLTALVIVRVLDTLPPTIPHRLSGYDSYIGEGSRGIAASEPCPEPINTENPLRVNLNYNPDNRPNSSSSPDLLVYRCSLPNPVVIEGIAPSPLSMDCSSNLNISVLISLLYTHRFKMSRKILFYNTLRLRYTIYSVSSKTTNTTALTMSGLGSGNPLPIIPQRPSLSSLPHPVQR